MTRPAPQNACAGAFSDWLEVMLTPECNGTCPWCVERGGYRPSHVASCERMAEAILSSAATNVILLGGEPTLYPYLAALICRIKDHKSVYVTTNGSLPCPWTTALADVTGVNVSVHHYHPRANHRITGIALSYSTLLAAIAALHRGGTTVRFNCNVIRGHIDCEIAMRQYIAWAKDTGADSVRFAELKGDDKRFVSLADIWGHNFGLNDDPFTLGCHVDTAIDGMPVNFRQMCGLQTPLRPCPANPVQIPKPVLYYDGLFYMGWQRAHKESVMTSKEKEAILGLVAKGDMAPASALALLFPDSRTGTRQEPAVKERQPVTGGGGHCVY